MGGSENLGRISWDSCVFLAWFKDESDKPLNAIERLLRSVEARAVTLIVSAIVCAEVLDESGESTAGTDFRDFMRRSNAMEVSQKLLKLEGGLPMSENLAHRNFQVFNRRYEPTGRPP